MGSDSGEKCDGDGFDVVLLHGLTRDGEGARVLRARPGQVEVGEIRPIRDGQPLAAGREVVRLVERPEAPCLYDVKTDFTVPSQPSSRAAAGPAQVATPAYRDSWERTFATPSRLRDLN